MDRKRGELPVALWGTALTKAEDDSESVASAEKPRVVPHHGNCSRPPGTRHHCLQVKMSLQGVVRGGEKNALSLVWASLQARSGSECLSPSPAACLTEPFLNRCCGPLS